MKKKHLFLKGAIAIIIIMGTLIARNNTQFNSKTKLDIVSVYGDNEAYHPKVVNFDSEWNGYKYWMAYTPYPIGDDSKENPHIVASNNLINWVTPEGLTNPLHELYHDGVPEQYNSDTHLIYNQDLKRLECFWRYVDDLNNNVIIYESHSENGRDFSEKEVFIESKNRKDEDYVSPAILYENGTYKMWFINKKKVQYKELKKGENWTNTVDVTVNYKDSQLRSWHIDVIATEKGYEMLTVAYPNSTNDRETMKLYYTYSKSEKKGWSTAEEILAPTRAGFFDNQGLYRSCMIYENGVYIVFYSGMDRTNGHGIGIVYGKDIKNLKKVDINFFKNKDSDEMLKLIEQERTTE